MERQGSSLSDTLPYLAFSLGAELGESPVWSSREGMLYFLDISRATMHRLDPNSGACDDYCLPARSTAVVLTCRRTLVVAMGGSLVELIPETWTNKVLVELHNHGTPDDVFNDAKCDRTGRLWIGTRHRARLPGHSTLWRIEPNRGLVIADGGFTVANGIAWSPAGDVLYLADSRQQAIFRYTVHGRSGATGDRTVFTHIAPPGGAPDGLTVDADGCVWAALWGGSSLRRYAPDGSLERTIILPVAYPTSCIFGGPDMETLYVTSATAPGQRSGAGANPQHEGAIFTLRTGIRGIEETPMQMSGM